MNIDNQSPDILLTISWLYLTAPYLIFLFYLHNPVSIIGALAGFLLIKRNFFAVSGRKNNIKISVILITFLFTLAVIFLCGGMFWIFGVETNDWIKHNTVLNDLIRFHWPVIYPFGSTLNYYLAFYLPAAVVGKITGSFMAAKIFLSFWTILGLFIAFLHVGLYSGQKNNPAKVFLALFSLAIFSGSDWIAYLVKTRKIPGWGQGLEWSAGPDVAQISSIITSIAWVPQHFIPAAIIIPIILSGYYRLGLLLVPVLLLWSPFTTLGAGLVLFLFYFFDQRRRPANLKDWSVIYDGILLAAFSLPVVFFYGLHNKIDFFPRIFLSSGDYLLFIGTELGGLGLALFLLRRELRDKRWPVFFMLAALIIEARFKFGSLGLNDLMMRSSTPLLLALVLLVIRHVFCQKDRLILLGTILLLISGGLTPLNEVVGIMRGRQIAAPEQDIRHMFHPDKYLYTQHLGHASLGWPPADFINAPLFWPRPPEKKF